jgi:hypothetical protein
MIIRHPLSVQIFNSVFIIVYAYANSGMSPKRTIDSFFFKKLDRYDDGHGREQNNSPVVAEERRTAEEQRKAK